MSRAELIYTVEARRDLREIADHLEEQAGRHVAAKWSRRLEERALALRDAPFLGAADERLGGRRRLVVSPYLIVYLVASPTEVRIVRVVDGRRDLPALFPVEASEGEGGAV